MEIIKIKKYKSVCEEIHYEIKDGKLNYVDFWLNKKAVLKEFKNTFTGLSVEDVIKKAPVATINPIYLIILKEFAQNLEATYKNLIIKNKILKLKKG